MGNSLETEQMVNDKELAAIIARDIFKVFDEPPRHKCQRIQGKGGKWPDEEIGLGGLCEESLANVIERSLSANRSY